MNTNLSTASPTRTDVVWPARGLRLGPRRGRTLDLGFVADKAREVLGVPVHQVDGRWQLHRPGSVGSEAILADDVGHLVPRWKAIVPLTVDVTIWQEAGRGGVLFMLMDGAGLPDENDNQAIADRLNRKMATTDPLDLELSVVPSAAVPDDGPSGPVSRAEASRLGSARAAPTDRTRLRVVLASCQYTVGLLDGTPGAERLTPGPGDASFARLLQRLQTAGWRRPDALILTGDQVYVDATAGLFDPGAVSGSHDAPYHRLLESRYASNVLRQLQVCPLIDDHEIVNNYEPSANTFQNEQFDRVLHKGRMAYIRHQRKTSLLRNLKDDATELWDAIEIAGFHFFCADTRTEREARSAVSFGSNRGEPPPHILGPKQLAALVEWLMARSGDDQPCFVVSPSTFLPRKLQTLESRAAALRSDAWDGYPASMSCVLDAVAQAGCKVVFLSGDEHRCLFTRAWTTDSELSLEVHSVHSSALYAPYPFANSRPEDFAGSGDSVTTAGKRTWSIEAEVMPAGDGFCVIDVARDDKGWRVDLQFDLFGQVTPIVRGFRP